MNKLIYVLIFLQTSVLYAADSPPASGNEMYKTFAMILIAMLFFYFIMWRPEQKRRKALEEQRASLKQGDRVTAMGIIGTVARILDGTVILKMYDGSKIEVLRGAITDVMPEAAKEKVPLEQKTSELASAAEE